MSLWKWNEVELEINMNDVDFAKKYEKAFEKVGKAEEALQKVGFNSEFLKGYCDMYMTLFDDIFGEGTSERLFEGKRDAELVEECYDSFLEVAKKDVAETNKRRAKRIARYTVKKGK